MADTPRPNQPTHTRLDARAMRVLAHPLRVRLIGLLRREGPATATTLAEGLATNTGATSYHLRKLAEVGLVEETGAGRGRERWWRAAHEMHSWFASDFGDDPDAEAAEAWLQGEHLRLFQEYADQWQRTRADWPTQWRDGAGASDYFLDLSAHQLRDLMDELYAVIERYRAAGPDDDAARVFLFLHAFPQRPGSST